MQYSFKSLPFECPTFLWLLTPHFRMILMDRPMILRCKNVQILNWNFCKNLKNLSEKFFFVQVENFFLVEMMVDTPLFEHATCPTFLWSLTSHSRRIKLVSLSIFDLTIASKSVTQLKFHFHSLFFVGASEFDLKWS